MMEVRIRSNPVSEAQAARLERFLKSRVAVSPVEYSKIMSEKENSYGKFRGEIAPRF